MKRVITTALCLTMAISMVACGKKVTEPETTAPVIETEAPTEEATSVPQTEAESEAPDLPRYSTVTECTDEEVEAFAEDVRSYFLNHDWEALSQVIYYPIIINGTYYVDQEAFLKTNWSDVFDRAFFLEMEEADSKDMVCNWAGIRFGNVCFTDVDGLRIIDIYFEDGVSSATGDLVGHYEWDIDLTNENLKQYDSVWSFMGSGVQIGGSMEMRADGTFEYGLAIADEQEGTYIVDGGKVVLTYYDVWEQKMIEVESPTCTIDGVLYLVTTYEGENMYWKKLATPQKNF